MKFYSSKQFWINTQVTIWKDTKTFEYSGDIVQTFMRYIAYEGNIFSELK